MKIVGRYFWIITLVSGIPHTVIIRTCNSIDENIEGSDWFWGDQNSVLTREVGLNQSLDWGMQSLQNCSNGEVGTPQNDTLLNKPDQSETSVIFTGLISRQTYEKFKFITGVAILPCIALFGFLGNCAAIMVLGRRPLGEGVNTYLKALSITDMCFTIFKLLNFPVHIISIYNSALANSINAILLIPTAFLFPLITRCSSLLIVILSTGRFVAVRFPLKIKRFILSKHQGKITAMLYLLIMITQVPMIFRYKTLYTTDERTNETFLVTTSSDFARSTNFFQYYSLATRILFRVFPLVTVLILNVLTISSLQIWKKHREAIANLSGTKSDSKITHLLLTITAIFIICISPSTINFLIAEFSDVWGFAKKEHFTYLFVQTFCSIAGLLNSSVNFLVYMFMSGTFRKTFQEIFCSRRKSSMSPGTTNPAVD